jgi:hypothetical protein
MRIANPWPLVTAGSGTTANVLADTIPSLVTNVDLPVKLNDKAKCSIFRANSYTHALRPNIQQLR